MPAVMINFSYRDNREVSYYGSAVYTYDSRYTLSGTFRIDESNLFGAAKNIVVIHCGLWD